MLAIENEANANGGEGKPIPQKRQAHGPFGTRHQSVDVAAQPRGQLRELNKGLGLPRPSNDLS